jgi:hypothetical protein
VRETWIDKDTSAQGGAILRTLCATLQRSPAPDDKEVWQAEEYDATGLYQAEYRAQGERLERKKLGYTSLLVSGPLNTAQRVALLPKIETSIMRAVLVNGLPRHIEFDEKSASELALGHTLAVTTRMELEHMPQLQVQQPLAVAALRERTRALSASAPYPSTVRRDQFDDVRIAGATLQQTLQTLERHHATRDPNPSAPLPEEAGQAYAALVALIRRDAQVAPELVARIRAGSPLHATFLNALSSAGSSSSKQALGEIAKDTSMSRPLRVAALTNLARSPDPTSASVEALGQLVDDPQLGEPAIFGLGSAARRLREGGNAELSAKQGRVLAGLLERAKDADARVRVLRGISNSGDSSLLGYVAPFLEAKEPTVRQAAVDALRLMADARVDPLLAARLHDVDLSVRVTTLSAAKERPEPRSVLIDALTALASDREQHNTARYHAIKALGSCLPSHRELEPVLQKLNQSETRKEIRSALSDALAVASRPPETPPR